MAMTPNNTWHLKSFGYLEGQYEIPNTLSYFTANSCLCG